MKKDLCVTQIFNVYHNRTSKWQRNKPIPRSQDGLVVFTEGEIEYTFEDRTFRAGRGTALLLPKDMPYSGIARTPQVAYFCLDFDLLSEEPFCDFGAPCAVPLTDFDAICAEFANTVKFWEEQRIDASVRAKSFFYTVWGQLLCQEEKYESNHSGSDLVTYICNHYSDQDLTVSKLCKDFFISESQLRRNVLKVTGLTPNEYIMHLRLTCAKRELICTQKSIGEIARVCGFASTYYFSRCFHAHVGLSPREYRAGNLML